MELLGHLSHKQGLDERSLEGWMGIHTRSREEEATTSLAVLLGALLVFAVTSVYALREASERQNSERTAHIASRSVQRHQVASWRRNEDDAF